LRTHAGARFDALHAEHAAQFEFMDRLLERRNGGVSRPGRAGDEAGTDPRARLADSIITRSLAAPTETGFVTQAGLRVLAAALARAPGDRVRRIAQRLPAGLGLTLLSWVESAGPEETSLSEETLREVCERVRTVEGRVNGAGTKPPSA
jgi:hypothetical protein